MSRTVDSAFSPQLRERLLSEIRNYLPAFLSGSASERHDPAGDVRELLNLEPGDLEQVVSVHRCLDERVLELGRALGQGLRYPIGSSDRRREVRQSVRGPVDWSATVAGRSLEGGNPSLFVTRGAARVFDTPEARALVWLLDRLRDSAKLALQELRNVGPVDAEGPLPTAWAEKIQALSQQVRAARQVEWLRGVEPQAPTAATLRRLRAYRGGGFYAERVAPALRAVLDLDSPSDRVLAEILSRRYFEPAENWVIFEVHVALSLARAFAIASGHPRKTRLLIGSDRASFARYGFDDGSEVALIRQGWPPHSGSSFREAVCARHGLGTQPRRPDIFIVRSGPRPDAAVLELKASFNRSTLVGGLSQILAYMAERPSAWSGPPAGWLVAPDPTRFAAHAAVAGEPLWMVGADSVAAAAVERFAPAAGPS